MAFTWNDVYIIVCDILLEPGGLRLGLLTDAQFLQIASEAHIDFCTTTGIAQKIFNTTAHFSVGQYSYANTLSEVESVLAGGTYLMETSDYHLSNSDPRWQTRIGMPEAYRQDDVIPLQIEITPTPATEGNRVVIIRASEFDNTVALDGTYGYGVIAAVQLPYEFTLVPDPRTPAGWGMVSEASGSIYLETINPAYGVVSTFVPSRNNLSLIGTALPSNSNPALGTYVELVPDGFAQYLTYGILQRVFSSDSELKDTAKANYCAARYQEGLNLLAAVLGQPDSPTEQS